MIRAAQICLHANRQATNENTSFGCYRMAVVFGVTLVKFTHDIKHKLVYAKIKLAFVSHV